MISKQEISSFEIRIEGFTNPKEFVEKWSIYIDMVMKISITII